MGFARLQEIADSWDLFGKVVRKLLTGTRDESEGAVITKESEGEGDRVNETVTLQCDLLPYPSMTGPSEIWDYGSKNKE